MNISSSRHQKVTMASARPLLVVLILLPSLLLLSILFVLRSHATATATTAAAASLPPVMWFAPFLSGGGYCSEAISFVQALVAHGVTVHIEQHGDSFSRRFVEGLDQDVKQLLMSSSDLVLDPGQSIVLCHSEPGAWHPPKYSTTRCPPKGARYRVGRTMFETDRLPQGWEDRLNTMDEVWVPTSFHRAVFEAGGVDPAKLVVVGEPVDTTFFDPDTDIPPYPLLTPTSSPSKGAQDSSSSLFVFLSVFKWEERKGWDVLLKAYLTEFLPPPHHHGDGGDGGGDRVMLVILTNAYHGTDDFHAKISSMAQATSFPGTTSSRRPRWPQDFPPVKVLSGVSQLELVGLYKACDVLVVPSRGEGWGRPHVEAMAMGKPIIATNWSGPTEYLDESNGYPLRYDGLTEITDGPFKGHKWASPSQSHLQQLMRHAYTHPQECRAKGVVARQTMVSRYSPEVMGHTLVAHLHRIQERIQEEKGSRKRRKGRRTEEGQDEDEL